jgi:hypothetical protein
VSIIRSPEETVLEFRGKVPTLSPEAQLYFSKTKSVQSEGYIDLGPLDFKGGTMVYGMPPSLDTDTYSYILLYNPDTNTTEFTAIVD